MLSDRADLVLAADRRLKWRALDPLERLLMLLCGACLVGFTSTTLLDVIARIAGHPLLWPPPYRIGPGLPKRRRPLARPVRSPGSPAGSRP